MMNLLPEQTQALATWVRDGANLSEVQKRLESEFGLRLTYMDVRFLVDDLDLELVAPSPAFAEPIKPAGPAAAPGKVNVSVDRLTRPGALVSGSVTFSDGVSATWMMDQMGRLSLNPSTPGYKPNEADIQTFQSELRQAIEKSGMF